MVDAQVTLSDRKQIQILFPVFQVPVTTLLCPNNFLINKRPNHPSLQQHRRLHAD